MKKKGIKLHLYQFTKFFIFRTINLGLREYSKFELKEAKEILIQ